MSRVVLAMSGGVDSSVAAHLLLREGHEVVGVFMRHGEESADACRADADAPAPLPVLGGRADHKQGCCSATDAADARRVATALGIPFYALNLQKDFRRIVDYFVDAYTRGRTPNPCVQCNHWIKFGRLFDYADSIDADFVATGHYARLEPTSGGPMALWRGRDTSKDQSYALFGIRRELLPRMLLPVGGYTKREIRALAADLGLGVADKRDSQEICFVPSGDHADFVRRRRGGESTAGAIVTTAGEVVGEHSGIEGFTIGQRKGLGVALGTPHFVVRIEPETRQVVIGSQDELLCAGLEARQANWMIDPPAEPLRCQVKIRYNGPPIPATVLCGTAAAGNENGLGQDPPKTFSLRFDEPQGGVAPGQAAVLYDGDRLLGGGWIERAAAEETPRR